MKITTIILAITCGAAAVPAVASSGDEQHAKLTYNARTGKYCMAQQITGQRLPAYDCRTKDDWIKDGAKFVDVTAPTKLAQK